MNNLQQELWTAFNDIAFDELQHKYTDSLGTKYKSATGWIQQFFPDKDWHKIAISSAKKCLLKDGVTNATDEMIEDVANKLQDKWKMSGEYACALGTQIHLVLENLWAKKNYRFDDNLSELYTDMRDDFEFRKTRAQELFKKLKNIYAPVANEFIVYDQPNGICGTIDMIAYNMRTCKYAIFDWKTSKKFEIGNNFNEYLKAPFDDIESCNTAEYSLQLSLYKYMLEKHTSIRIDEMLLFQIPGKESAMPQIFHCYDFSDRIAKLLQ